MQNYHFHSLDLDLTIEQAAHLKSLYAKLLEQLERLQFITPPLFDELTQAMREYLFQQPGFQNIWEKAENAHHTIHLRHSDNELLNLPWRLAVEDRRGLYLSKGISGKSIDSLFQPQNALPLKILVMVSSPEDLGTSERLSYEDEEAQIIRAFEPLFAHGQVEIDFTNDGSLGSLQEKIEKNPYHILHFSGHGVFKDGKGYLLLEDELTLNRRLVEADEFAAALNTKPEHRPSLVLLSSCQTAQGTVAESFRGVSNCLLETGVPAVIAMGFSILDFFATQFAVEFYNQLANREHLDRAFSFGIRYIRQLESKWLRQQGRNTLPSQWMIPQLYTIQQVVHLVDRQRPAEKLAFISTKFVTGQERLLLEAQPGYLFIGRRRERRDAMQHLSKNHPVLLRGQGGVGKTALAEHIAARLIARNPRVQPFVVDEKRPNLIALIDGIIGYLEQKQRYPNIRSEVAAQEKSMDKLHFLIKKLVEVCTPLFVFDNLESYQDGKGGKFLPQHADLLEGIQFIMGLQQFPIICTARYPLADFPDMPATDLNSVGYNDFHKKCERLALSYLRQQLDQPDSHDLTSKRPDNEGEKATYHAVVKLLHQALGGNYRALEYFDELYIQKKQGIYDTLKKLDDFRQQISKGKTAVQERLQEGSKALVFSELIALLNGAEQQVLQRLAQFRVPVLSLALLMQENDNGATAYLERLAGLTLAEQQVQPFENGQVLAFYYVPPLVRDWLGQQKSPEVAFSQEQAGRYFEFAMKNVTQRYIEYEEAFHHYFLAGDRERVNEIGEKLCDFFYSIQLFQNAFFYGKQTEALVGEDVKGTILNNLGLINNLFGHLRQALLYYEKNLKKLQSQPTLGKRRRREGAILNNISQIYKAQGDYPNALRYLEQSLKIMQEIGDWQGVGAIFNNIGKIHKAQGDYPNALRFLKQSLKIRREIGDQLGEGATLSNIGQIYQVQEDYPIALQYLEQSLKITQETGNQQGEGVELNNLATIALAQGNYPNALRYLEQGLIITQKIGDRKQEGVTLSNLGAIAFAQGDYLNALRYQEQSLKIMQKINDRRGEATALNNLSKIAHMQGDYPNALRYLEQSLNIAQEISDRQSESYTLHNLAVIAFQNKDFGLFLKYEMQAWQLVNEMDDAMGIFNIGRDLGGVLCQSGQKAQGLSMLHRSYDIARRSGLPGAKHVKAMIDKFS